MTGRLIEYRQVVRDGGAIPIDIPYVELLIRFVASDVPEGLELGGAVQVASPATAETRPGVTVTALEAIGANLEDLALFLDGAAELVADLEVEELVELRSRLDDLQTQARAAVTSVDHRLLELLEPGVAVNTAHGQVIVETKGKQTTKGAALALRLAARVADTPADEEGQASPPAVLTPLTAEELIAVGLHRARTST